MNTNKKVNNAILAQQILEKMGSGDEFLTDPREVTKPSRLENRREREKKHKDKKRYQD